MSRSINMFSDRTALPGIAIRCHAIGFPLLAPLAPPVKAEPPRLGDGLRAALDSIEGRAIQRAADARAERLRSFRLCHALTVEENARRWFEVAGG